jgi:predicted ATPase with chaperone activity
VGVRVWGVVGDRLVEVVPGSRMSAAGFRIDGLPSTRARTTANRVRAALINSGLVDEVPASTIRLEPCVGAGRTSDLDLAIALALLARAGSIGTELQWVFAAGRLGLDGAVYSEDLEESVSIVTVVTALRGGVG